MGDASPHEAATPRRELLWRERERILTFLSERGVRDVRLFGSLAREDDAADSDIDLLVELSEPASVASELLAVLGLSEELSDLLGVRVDVVSPRTLRSEVRDVVVAEAVPL